MSFCIGDEKLLVKYKAIWTKIEDSKNIELNALPVFDDRYTKIKVRTYGDKAYTNLLLSLYWRKCARRWYSMWTFYSHFYWFFMKTNIICKYIKS